MTVRGMFSAFPIAAGLVWKLGTLPGMIAHTIYGIRAMNVRISQYDSQNILKNSGPKATISVSLITEAGCADTGQLFNDCQS